MTDHMQTMEQLQEEVARLQRRIAELEESQAIAQKVLDALPAIIFCKDVHGNILLVNTANEIVTGLQRSQMIGKNQADLFPPEFVADWQERERQVVSTGKTIDKEEDFPQSDGMHTYLSSTFPIYDEQGNISAIGGISTDITERKKQEEELRTFKTLVENAPGLISVSGIDGRYHYFNPAFRERLCIPPDASPQEYKISDMSPPEMREELEQNLVPYIIEQGSWQGRSIFCSQDGSRFPGDLAVFVARDDNGNPEQFVAIATDVTAQVAAEEERVTLQQQVIEAQREALREISTPLIPVADKVVIMPLIGTIDSQRAQMVMEALLEGVAHHQAEFAILDITGVKVVDTQVAQALIQAAQAVKLLGARVVLTGIQPQIAQTLVHLGADLNDIVTRSTLQAGIAAALE